MDLQYYWFQIKIMLKDFPSLSEILRESINIRDGNLTADCWYMLFKQNVKKLVVI